MVDAVNRAPARRIAADALRPLFKHRTRERSADDALWQAASQAARQAAALLNEGLVDVACDYAQAYQLLSSRWERLVALMSSHRKES